MLTENCSIILHYENVSSVIEPKLWTIWGGYRITVRNFRFIREEDKAPHQINTKFDTHLLSNSFTQLRTEESVVSTESTESQNLCQRCGVICGWHQCTFATVVKVKLEVCHKEQSRAILPFEWFFHVTFTSEVKCHYIVRVCRQNFNKISS